MSTMYSDSFYCSFTAFYADVAEMSVSDGTERQTSDVLIRRDSNILYVYLENARAKREMFGYWFDRQTQILVIDSYKHL